MPSYYVGICLIDCSNCRERLRSENPGKRYRVVSFEIIIYMHFAKLELCKWGFATQNEF